MGDREKKGPICKKVVIFRLCNVSKYPKIFHLLWKFDHAKANPLVLKTIRFPLPNFWKKKWTHEKENMICNCTAKVRIGGKMTRKWGSFLEGEREREIECFLEKCACGFFERERERSSLWSGFLVVVAISHCCFSAGLLLLLLLLVLFLGFSSFVV